MKQYYVLERYNNFMIEIDSRLSFLPKIYFFNSIISFYHLKHY